MRELLGIPITLSIGNPFPMRAIIAGMDMPMTIGERLKVAREELQVAEGIKPNQAAFAREIGIEPPSLSGIESGDSGAPSSQTLLAIRDRGINPD